MAEEYAKNSGYAKRPLGQWIVLYLVIGGAIYGLIYYFVIAKKGGYTYPTSDSGQNTQYTYPTP